MILVNKVNLDKEKNNLSNIDNKLLSEINFLDIIKSYFCFKEKKTKLVNLCHNIIIEDMSFEKILKRIYSLENIPNHYYSKKIRAKMKKSKHKILKKGTQDKHGIEKKEDKRIKNNIAINI